MSKQTEQKLLEAQRELELYSDNVKILQEALTKASTEYTALLSGLQLKINLLETPLSKAKANFDSASREFARAQKVFEQEQSSFRKAQELYEQKRQAEMNRTESLKARLEDVISNTEKELQITNARVKNAQRDVAEYIRQQEKEKRDHSGPASASPKNTNDTSGGRRNNLVA
jgi:ATP-dependent Clp protease ATP-binding subunit ClpA